MLQRRSSVSCSGSRLARVAPKASACLAPPIRLSAQMISRGIPWGPGGATPLPSTPPAATALLLLLAALVLLPAPTAAQQGCNSALGEITVRDAAGCTAWCQKQTVQGSRAAPSTKTGAPAVVPSPRCSCRCGWCIFVLLVSVRPACHCTSSLSPSLQPPTARPAACATSGRHNRATHRRQRLPLHLRRDSELLRTKCQLHTLTYLGTLNCPSLSPCHLAAV